MPDANVAFVGRIPENYDRYLGPMFFEHYADDLAARVPVRESVRVLEVACGTGILTSRLVARVGGRGTIVATDLNETMLTHARGRLPRIGRLEWRPADGTSLPFPEASFDVVVCQFGVMFFPDKAAGMREAFRVLRPGGTYLFNVWDAIEHNPIPRIAHESVAAFFPDDPPQFYTVPFGFNDRAVIERLLADAGFHEIRCEPVAKEGKSPSAAEATIGLIEGNPILGAIMQRRPEALSDIKTAVAGNLARQLGDQPMRGRLRALVFSARR